MYKFSMFRAICVAIPATFVQCATVLAGPIVPPAGSVTSTGKTLAEIEPRIAVNSTNTPGDNDLTPSVFKITQPGSYYLTDNITGVAGKHGIEIAANGVTLDLNGFDLAGVAGSLSGVVVVSNSLRNISVINGSVRDWGADGVGLSVGNPSAGRIDRVTAFGNGGFGIRTGSGYTVTLCSASSNIGGGVNVGAGSTINQCAARGNQGIGIQVANSCTVVDCSAFVNLSIGIVVGSGCVVSGCSARSNSADGISVVSSNLVRDCVCSSNGVADGAGIHVTGSDNRIEGNICSGADRGIEVDIAGNIIIRNACSGNTTDWVIAANNTYGPIIDRRIPTTVASTPAVNGATAISTLGSTDPNANFTY